MDVFEEDAIIAKISGERADELLDMFVGPSFRGDWDALTDDEQAYVEIIIAWREAADEADWEEE